MVWRLQPTSSNILRLWEKIPLLTVPPGGSSLYLSFKKWNQEAQDCRYANRCNDKSRFLHTPLVNISASWICLILKLQLVERLQLNDEIRDTTVTGSRVFPFSFLVLLLSTDLLSWAADQSDFSHCQAPPLIQSAKLAEKPPTRGNSFQQWVTQRKKEGPQVRTDSLDIGW